MKEKIPINKERLNWCLKYYLNEAIPKKLAFVYEELKEEKVSFTIKQLETIATFFGRSLCFFINPNKIKEEKLLSPQFRTLNNQKNNISIKNKKLIERVEKHREIYKGILEDLEVPIVKDWHHYKNKKPSAIRRMLCLDKKNDFESIRKQIESIGIMVILSSGYNGDWQVDNKHPIVGFSLCYEALPIIFVKKENTKQRQTFTLLHELAHLLLHGESFMDEEVDFLDYKDKEKEANEFASKVLIPDDFLNTIDTNKIKERKPEALTNYLEPFKKEWGASVQAIMVRLLKNHKITQETYNDYENFTKKQKENNKQSLKDIKNQSIPRTYRHREPLKIFGERYVKSILDALQNEHITLYKAATYLDNLKVDTLKKLQYEL